MRLPRRIRRDLITRRAKIEAMKSFIAAAAVLGIGAACLSAADPAFERAWNKLDLIESGRARPGSVFVFTPAEMNAWARARVPQEIEGVRDPRIELGNGAATGYALIDFVKMRQGEGIPTNPLLARLISGERPVKVTVRLASAAGRCTAYLTGMEINGVSASGQVLDALVNWFFKPLFPGAKINEPFDLRDGIERIEVRPDGVRVAMKR
jgi:hypothetical protein